MGNPFVSAINGKTGCQQKNADQQKTETGEVLYGK
jgi:hypothetical protein